MSRILSKQELMETVWASALDDHLAATALHYIDHAEQLQAALDVLNAAGNYIATHKKEKP